MYTYYPTTYPMYQQNQQTSMIWVGSMAEAQMYPVAPNNAVTLWDSTTSAIYLKQADATGKPTMRVYDLVERSTAPPAPAGKDEYVTKNELTGVLDAVQALKSDIDTMKGDIYGIAGKRKKKEEEVE